MGLAHAMNMRRVLEHRVSRRLRAASQRLQGSYWGYTNPTVRALPFDLAKANEYFDAAGWTERGPDGIRMKDGQRLAVTISYGTDEHSPWLIVVREEAKKAGIELNLQLLDPATWGRQMQEKKHQIIVMAFGREPHAVVLASTIIPTTRTSRKTNNITNTDNPELDKLIEEYDSATELERARRSSRTRSSRSSRTSSSFIPSYKLDVHARDVLALDEAAGVARRARRATSCNDRRVRSRWTRPVLDRRGRKGRDARSARLGPNVRRRSTSSTRPGASTDP